jgi:pilus assembly protein CpaB
MSKMRVIMFGVAAVSAVMAGLISKGYLGQSGQVAESKVEKVKKTEILVASKDINMGDRLAEGAIAWLSWPAESVQDAMITKDEKPDALVEYKEARARTAIFNGEPIIEKKVIDPGKGGFMGALLPKGKRAISVAVSERTSAGGFILPNDRVDVILTKKTTVAANTIVTSDTVLSNVRVLAINQTYRQEAEGDNVSVAEGKTATLELTSLQSEVIARIESQGELTLALRSIAENDGKALENIQPQLADKYSGDRKKAVSSTLFVRYGVETYASNP